MAAIPGQPAPKPSQVKSPVANSNEDDDIQAMLAEFRGAPVGAPAEGEEENPDAILQEFRGAGAPQDDFALPPEPTPAPGPDQFEPEPGFIEANINQIKPENFITRLQTGLAANDTEKMNFLAKKYGQENVTMKDDVLYYRKNKKDKFSRLDPKTLEVISDIIPDFAREIITETAMLPGEIIGAAGGTAAAGPGPGTAGGVIAGRVASIPMANRIAEDVARAAGVEQDPTRDLRQENMIGMTTEAVLPVVGSKITKVVGKRIPGTAAYKAAKEAGENEAVALSRQSEEVLQAARELEQEGINAPLSLDQLQPDSPKVKSLVAKVQSESEFANKQLEVAKGFEDSATNLINDIARRSGGGNTPPGKLASTLTDAVVGIDKAEGKAIGAYKAKALAKTKNQKQQLPAETSQLATGMMRELGFQPKTVKLNSVTRPGSVEGVASRGGVQAPNQIVRQVWTKPKNMQEVAGRMGLKDPGQAQAVVNAINEYGQYISRGNEARLSDVEKLITRLGPMADSLQGTQAGQMLGKITGDLRKHRREMIGNGLDEVDKLAFNKSMDDFSLIRRSREQLVNVLRGDVTSKTLVNSFFKGKENLANIRALKTITGKNSPEWGALKEEFLNQLMLKHSGKADSPTRWASGAFLKDLKQNYGDEFLGEVLDAKDMKSLSNMFTYGERLEASIKGVKADVASEAKEKAITDAGTGFLFNVKFKMLNGVSKMLGVDSGKKNALLELYNRDGFHKYIANYKGPGDKKEALRVTEEILKRYNAARQASQAVDKTLDIGKDIIKRGVRADIREDLSR